MCQRKPIFQTQLFGPLTLKENTHIQANFTFQVDNAQAGMFFENNNVLSTNYTITTGKNAGSFGPIFISNGVTVTVTGGFVWSIV